MVDKSLDETLGMSGRPIKAKGQDPNAEGGLASYSLPEVKVVREELEAYFDRKPAPKGSDYKQQAALLHDAAQSELERIEKVAVPRIRERAEAVQEMRFLPDHYTAAALKVAAQRLDGGKYTRVTVLNRKPIEAKSKARMVEDVRTSWKLKIVESTGDIRSESIPSAELVRRFEGMVQGKTVAEFFASLSQTGFFFKEKFNVGDSPRYISLSSNRYALRLIREALRNKDIIAQTARDEALSKVSGYAEAMDVLEKSKAVLKAPDIQARLEQIVKEDLNNRLAHCSRMIDLSREESPLRIKKVGDTYSIYITDENKVPQRVMRYKGRNTKGENEFTALYETSKARSLKFQGAHLNRALYSSPYQDQPNPRDLALLTSGLEVGEFYTADGLKLFGNARKVAERAFEIVARGIPFLAQEDEDPAVIAEAAEKKEKAKQEREKNKESNKRALAERSPYHQALRELADPEGVQDGELLGSGHQWVLYQVGGDSGYIFVESTDPNTATYVIKADKYDELTTMGFNRQAIRESSREEGFIGFVVHNSEFSKDGSWFKRVSQLANEAKSL